MKRSHGAALAAVTMVVLTILLACTPIKQGGGGPLPTVTVPSPPPPAVTRPPLLIQYCDDDTGSYPRQDFLDANQLMARSLQQVVTANQQGITLYATAITSHTFDSANTLDPAFTVPAFPAFPAPPTPLPTHAPQNPVSDPATATAVATQSVANIVAYNNAVAAIAQQIKTAQTAVAADTQRLTTWNPPIDATATSILGCFQLAASRFAGKSDKKLVYIASDLENNTDVDYTQGFVTNHALEGAVVHVIYFYSQNAPQSTQTKHDWCAYLKSAGASAVSFDDRATSSTATDLINQDATVSDQPCLY